MCIRDRGHAALVDCGSKNSYIDAGAIAADYLRSAGATLDSVVLTHYHEDHANGLAALFARVDVDTIYLADIDEMCIRDRLSLCGDARGERRARAAAEIAARRPGR